jgi:hypothetical protein
MKVPILTKRMTLVIVWPVLVLALTAPVDLFGQDSASQTTVRSHIHLFWVEVAAGYNFVFATPFSFILSAGFQHDREQFLVRKVRALYMEDEGNQLKEYSVLYGRALTKSVSAAIGLGFTEVKGWSGGRDRNDVQVGIPFEIRITLPLKNGGIGIHGYGLLGKQSYCGACLGLYLGLLE